MNRDIQRYLAEIGRKGGQSSRRTLDPQTARAMVALREARRAYRRFHAQCFWSSPADLLIKAEDIRWVAKQLMTHGGRAGWTIGAKLCR